MRLPVFNCFDYEKNYNFYKCFSETNPMNAYRIMKEIKELDSIRFKKDISDGPDNLDNIMKRTLSYMNSLPDLKNEENLYQADLFANYMHKLQFEFTYLLSFADDEKKINEVINIENFNNLEIAKKYGNAPIFLPMHIGPAYFIPIVLSYILTNGLLTMFTSMNLETLLNLCVPNLKSKLQGIGPSEVQKLKKILSSLKNGKSFCIFPEYNPNGVGRHYQEVQFFGGNIKAPIGPAIISKLSGCPVIPVVMTSNNNGTFILKFLDVIPPCKTDKDVENCIKIIWESLELELCSNNYGEWEIWYDFESILSK